MLSLLSHGFVFYSKSGIHLHLLCIKMNIRKHSKYGLQTPAHRQILEHIRDFLKARDKTKKLRVKLSVLGISNKLMLGYVPGLIAILEAMSSRKNGQPSACFILKVHPFCEHLS